MRAERSDRLELLHAIDDDLLLTCYTLKGHMEYFFGPMRRIAVI